MQEKYIDNGDQLIGDEHIGDLFAGSHQDNEDIATVPAIQIVHFDDSDHPADIETRPLHSFL